MKVINEPLCNACANNGYLEVTCPDNYQYIQACDNCEYFGDVKDLDDIAMEKACEDGYELRHDGLVLNYPY